MFKFPKKQKLKIVVNPERKGNVRIRMKRKEKRREVWMFMLSSCFGFSKVKKTHPVLNSYLSIGGLELWKSWLIGYVMLQGDLYDHESLVKAIKQVDVVISTVGRAQLSDQVKIIAAIKEAGNVKVKLSKLRKFLSSFSPFLLSNSLFSLQIQYYDIYYWNLS